VLILVPGFFVLMMKWRARRRGTLTLSGETAAEALLGRDEYCVAYLRAFRDGKLELKAA